jgi:hypothetical protein
MKLCRNIFLYLFLFSTFLYAQEQEFDDFYYSDQLSSRHCGVNTAKFIKYLSNFDVKESSIYTVVITAPGNRWGFGRVLAVNSRWGKSINGNYHENWMFHVVTVIDGDVYDFSFNKNPLILSLAEYINKMFIPKNPFMPYGKTFSIANSGPWFTRSAALDELDSYEFDVYKTKNYKKSDLIYDGLTSTQLVEALD